ncbi:hypothetical protein HYT45_01680 [Candidatus Uhrbacteria bacterium]|nr:hypothetical protein [Candidatus Uhrbacteria bacterium]
MVDELKLALIKAILARAWSRETSSPNLRSLWTPQNPSLGQGAVTALVIHEMFGGYIMRAVVDGFGSHYYNILPDGIVCDLTKGQFPPDIAVPKGEAMPRERLLFGERARDARTQERYALLLSKVVDMFLG